MIYSIICKFVTNGTEITSYTDLRNLESSTNVDYNWWKELGRTTLATNGDNLTVSNLPNKKYLMVLFNRIDSGEVTPILRFNSDSGPNYSTRVEPNGIADVTAVSQSSANIGSAETNSTGEIILEITNNSNKEKMIIAKNISSPAGASNPPTKRISYDKWANTSSAIDTITISNIGTGDFAAGTELIVLGHN